MKIVKKAILAVAGAAVFGAGYVCGCAGSQDKDFRLLRDTDKAGIERAYLQDKQQTSRIYQITREENGLKFEEYNFNLDTQNSDAADQGMQESQESIDANL